MAPRVVNRMISLTRAASRMSLRGISPPYKSTISENYEQLAKSTNKVRSHELLVLGDSLLLLFVVFLNFAILLFRELLVL